MTNAEAAAHFAALPPDEEAEIVAINGDTSSAEVLSIDPPGTNLDVVEEEFLTEGDETLVTVFMQW